MRKEKTGKGKAPFVVVIIITAVILLVLAIYSTHPYTHTLMPNLVLSLSIAMHACT